MLNTHVNTVSSKDILQGKLNIADCLVIPGGADLRYCEKLNGSGNKNIQQFVNNGGLYIGICAGAYYGCSHIDFSGHGYKISGQRELGLFQGRAIGSLAELTNQRFYDESSKSKAMVKLQSDYKIIGAFYYHGGPKFLGAKHNQIVATYENGDIAVVKGTYGNGQYLLSGVHFELCPIIYQHYLANELSDVLSDECRQKERGILIKLRQPDYGQSIFDVIKQMIKCI